jgi:cellulose biosynthesis protein BcsQ
MRSELGKVVAFYSFKGGTGRTMALANVGCALAQERMLDRPVLLIDWDLEAPGLHRYFRRQVFDKFQGDDNLLDQAPGLIDLFIELRNLISSNSSPQNFEAARSLLNQLVFSRYIIETDIPRLHLLKAGRFDHDYAANVGSFQWPEFYRQSPHLLSVFADRLARDYSFVIIDSRTGLTDTSGICAMLMPEILIAVFVPNRQNLSGVMDLVREAARYRAKSDDLRPLLVYPLPSRIEASEPDLRRSWRFGDSAAGVPGFQKAFEELFKDIYALPACDLSAYFDDVQIQHVPRYAYGEEIAVLVEETRDRLSLTQSYLRFTARLIKAEPPWAGSSSTPAVYDKPYVYIVADTPDLNLARRLQAAARREAIADIMTEAQDDRRGDFEEAVKFATAIIFLHGAASPRFIDVWLKEYVRKTRLLKRSPPLVALYLAPPQRAPDEEPLIPFAELRSIGSREEFTLEGIDEIFRELPSLTSAS